MNNPVFFSETNTITETNANEYAKRLSPLFQWKNNEEVLDVGCGIGNVTHNVIMPMLPPSFKRIIAFDISAEMLGFTHKFSHPKIEYIQHDVAAKIPDNFEERFDHIFSFYCLHWVKDQKTAFQNLANMLKPGGQMMLTIVADSRNFNTLEELKKNYKWNRYMQDMDETSYPYNFSATPKNDLEQHLLDNNFQIHHLQIEKKEYKFTKKDFEKFILALNPYIKHIPSSDQNEFVENYLEKVMKLEVVENIVSKTGEKFVVFKYTAMSAFVSKPVST